ncbi:MAG: hypothetical protein AAFQ02_10945 [Bacteroidota bacterium]
MPTSKTIIFYLFLGFLLGSCSSAEPPIDLLPSTGILGKWEIQNRSINGIEPLIVVCCEFIEFVADENLDDLTGDYSWSAGQFTGNGSFTLTEDLQGIILTDKNDIDSFTIMISPTQDAFELSYSDSQDAIVRELWGKSE